MKKIMNGAALIGAMTVMAAASTFAVEAPKAPAAPAKSAELFEDKVVAKGKGVEIKKSSVEEAYSLYKANMAARGQPVGDENRDSIEDQIIDKLLLTQLLLARSTPEDKTKATEATAKVIDDAKKRFGTDEVFNQQIKAMGLTPDKFKERVMEQNTCEEVINREVRTKVSVADADVKKYYDENPTKFDELEMVRAAHILIATADPVTREPIPADKKKEKEALAKKLRERAEKGEDFAKLAKEFSEDPGSKDKGGEYTFPKGQMMPAFEAAAFSLKTNQVSELVETPFGYHIIKLYEKIPAKRLELAKVSEDLKKGLQQEEVRKQLPAYFEKIKTEANVELLTERKKPAAAAVIPPSPVPVLPAKK